ncbi:hypothetical protein GGS24DRAFT_476140 [Hypoxylon argillaceum]|nr:hypothetical protein GGS24DRAFT_476140 [Hypoxylon argillaceum]
MQTCLYYVQYRILSAVYSMEVPNVPESVGMIPLKASSHHLHYWGTLPTSLLRCYFWRALWLTDRCANTLYCVQNIVGVLCYTTQIKIGTCRNEQYLQFVIYICTEYSIYLGYYLCGVGLLFGTTSSAVPEGEQAHPAPRCAKTSRYAIVKLPGSMHPNERSREGEGRRGVGLTHHIEP